MKKNISIKYVLLLLIGGFIVCLDQLTKIYIHTHFALGDSITVIPDYFNITYVRNTGAAFGVLRDAYEPFRNAFFLSIPLIAVGVIVYILRGLKDSEKGQILGLCLIFGGALGNYIDRLRFRYVIDFLDFHVQRKYTWPAFNVADMAIVGGVSLLLFIMFLQWKEERAQGKPNPSA